MGPIAEAFIAVVELAESLGVSHLNELPGLWTIDVDSQWSISVNGHKEPIGHVPPYHVEVAFNGWPAGLFSPAGGWIAAGEAANERAFVEAVWARIKKEKQSCPTS